MTVGDEVYYARVSTKEVMFVRIRSIKDNFIIVVDGGSNAYIAEKDSLFDNKKQAKAYFKKLKT